MGKLLAGRIEPTLSPGPSSWYFRAGRKMRTDGEFCSSRSGGAVSPGVPSGHRFSQATAAAPGIDAAAGTAGAPADIKLPRQVGSHKMRYVSNP